MQQQPSPQWLATSIAFGIFGFANVALPFIIAASNYLIIPYPRTSVHLIEILPALATKLVFPHLLQSLYLPDRFRVPCIALLWALAAGISLATPPNVEPPVRVFLVVLSSATAALTDLVVLGLTAYYGRVGVAGWSIGAGLGGMTVGILPYLLTVVQGGFLRDSLGYAKCLVALLVVAYYLVLPKGPTPDRTGAKARDESQFDHDDDATLLVQEMPPLSDKTIFKKKLRSDMTSLVTWILPYILPLAVVGACQSLAFPGISRALSADVSFRRYSSFAAVFGTAFYMGSTIGRCLILSRPQKPRMLVLASAASALITTLNTAVGLISATWMILTLVVILGAASGALLMNTYASTLEHGGQGGEAKREFRMMAVGFGDTVGILAGSLLAASWEQALCDFRGQEAWRWCHTTW